MELLGYSHSASPEMEKEINLCLIDVVPIFLAQFLKYKDFDTVSLEEGEINYLLDEVDGPDIVSKVGYIMDSVVKALTSSGMGDPVQHACKKLVSGIATYGIPRLIGEDKKGEIVYSLCKPLANCLLGSREGLVYGSAVCLEGLIGSANWRFASVDIVNDVCLKVAVALEEKTTQTVAHMSLAMALVKFHSFIVEPYTRSIMRSGLRILSSAIEVGDSQKQLSAIQMLILLMKCVDSRSVFSELELLIKESKKCYSSHIEFVRTAAFEAIKTARMIVQEKESRFEESGSITDSNFARRSSSRNNILRRPKDKLLVSASPDSRNAYSATRCNFSTHPLLPKQQFPCKIDYSGGVNRTRWKEAADGSLTNGFHSCMDLTPNGSKTDSELFYDGEISDSEVNDELFSGFMHATPGHGINPSTTPGFEKPQSQLAGDDAKVFTTRKEFIRSLQDPISHVPKKRIKRIRRPSFKKQERSVAGELYANHNFEISASKFFVSMEHAIGSNLASSSSGTEADIDSEGSHGVQFERKAVIERQSEKEKAPVKVGLNFVCGSIMIILAVILLYLWIDNQDGLRLCPT